MRILFMTKSKKYTCEFLQYLIEHHEVVAVVCKKKDILAGTEMQRLCQQNNIPVWENDALYERLERDDMPIIDLVISNTFGCLIKNSLISYVNGNCINFHGAILPDYRGVMAYNFGILNCEKEWGVTAHYVNEKFDEGDIIEIRRFEIDSGKISVSQLEEQTQKCAYHLMIDVVENWAANGKPDANPQTGEGHYYSRKDFENAKKIDLNMKAEEINRRIRAFYCPPYEGAYIEIDGCRFQLMQNKGKK